MRFYALQHEAKGYMSDLVIDMSGRANTHDIRTANQLKQDIQQKEFNLNDTWNQLYLTSAGTVSRVVAFR